MTLEANDINDKEILEQTRQENAPNGAIKFKIKLPSGREVASEWIAPDNQKGAILLWVAEIRNQIVADAAEKRAEARRIAHEREANEKRLAQEALQDLKNSVLASPSINAPLPGSGFATPQSAVAPNPGINYAQTVPASASPLEFARAQLVQAQQQTQHYQMTLMQAQAGLQQAQAAVVMWGQMVAQFEGNNALQFQQNGVIQHAKNISGVSGAASGGSRRGRPPGSKNKPREAGGVTGSNGGLIIGDGAED